MLEIRNMITKTRNAFNRFIIKIDMAGKRISVLEDRSTEIIQTKKQREKGVIKIGNLSKSFGNTKSSNLDIICSKKAKRERRRMSI